MNVTERLRDINEALFEAGAVEVVTALGSKDVLFFARNADGHWTTVVWIDAADAVKLEVERWTP